MTDNTSFNRTASKTTMRERKCKDQTRLRAEMDMPSPGHSPKKKDRGELHEQSDAKSGAKALQQCIYIQNTSPGIDAHVDASISLHNLPSSQNHHHLKKIRSITLFSRPDLYRFRSRNPPKLFLRMFPKPLHEPFLPEPGQQVLHLGSGTLTFQVDRVDTASYFPVGSSCDCNFTAQRDPRSSVSVRSCWVPARNIGSACSDYPKKTAS